MEQLSAEVVENLIARARTIAINATDEIAERRARDALELLRAIAEVVRERDQLREELERFNLAREVAALG